MSSITADNVVEYRDNASTTLTNNNATNQMRNLRVQFGIDEDLRMILEMDPSIIDLDVTNAQDYNPKPTKVIGLPPKSGGYVLLNKTPIYKYCILFFCFFHII